MKITLFFIRKSIKSSFVKIRGFFRIYWLHYYIITKSGLTSVRSDHPIHLYLRHKKSYLALHVFKDTEDDIYRERAENMSFNELKLNTGRRHYSFFCLHKKIVT